MTGKTVSNTAFEIMSKQPFTVSPDTTLAEAAALMMKENIGCLPVVDERGQLVGLLTERMFQAELSGLPRPFNQRSLAERTVARLYGGYGSDQTDRAAINAVGKEKVEDIMIEDPASVTEDTPTAEVANVMLRTHLSHVPVVRDRVVVGVIARHDLLRTLGV